MLTQYMRSPVAAGGAANRISVTAAIIVAGLVSACSSPLPPRYIRSAEPHIATPAVSHSSVVRGYISQRPVEPGPWLEQNENVAPRQKR
jgi:hypothetical protein